MPQSLAKIFVHLVFSTKNRRPDIRVDVRDKLHAYLAGACSNLDSPALIVGGVEDHVHLLLRLGKSVAISTVVREIKRESSKWMKTQAAHLASFQWQAGYGAFSISPSHIPALTEYIENQEEHHKRESFQDEFRRLCEKYGLEIDERYVWD